VTRTDQQSYIHAYELKNKIVERVPELEGTRYYIPCPQEPNKFLAATSEGTLRQMDIDSLAVTDSIECLCSRAFRAESSSETHQGHCRHPIARIASNKDGTIGFVVIQNQMIQKVNLKTFEPVGELIQDIKGAV